MTGPRFHIILVEDAEPDVLLVREALEQSGLEFELRVFDDGEQGVAFVETMDRDATLVQPHLFLLDLNLPKKTGGQILERVRQSPRCGQGRWSCSSTRRFHATCWNRRRRRSHVRVFRKAFPTRDAIPAPDFQWQGHASTTLLPFADVAPNSPYLQASQAGRAPLPR